MRKIIFIILVLAFCSINAQNNEGVGIGNSIPNGMLDLTNSTSDSKVYPLIAPVAVSESAVINPTGQAIVAGSLFYDSTTKCLKIHNGIQWKCIRFIAS
ncbi:MAG: hypothetical protein ACK5HU_04315 [Flavobacteriales bacterium]